MRWSPTRRNYPLQTSTITIIGVLLALFGFLLIRVWEFATGISVGRIGISVFKWTLVGLIILIVLTPEQEKLSSIGFAKPNRWDVVVGIGTFVLGILSLAIAMPVVDALGFNTAPFGNDQNGTIDETVSVLLIGLFVGVTAGITEEILYRGYALERLETLSGSTWIAATVTAFLFVVVHFGGHSFGGLLIITPLTILLTVAYVWRRNIFVPIIAHVLINGLWQFATLLRILIEAL